MKFAEIIYDKENKGHLIELYNSLFKPFSVEKTEAFGADGYIIKLNVSKEGKEQNKKRILNKAEKFLTENGVVATVGEIFRGLYTASGNIVRGLMADNVVKEAKEVVIIGGEEGLTKLLLAVVCPRVSQVSLLTDKSNSYYNYVQYFLSEYGISVQLIGSVRHENIKNADVIINCSNSKISCINSVDIKYMDKSLKEEIVEAAIYAIDMDFKKIADGSAENAEKLASYVDKQLKVVYNL